MTRVDRTTVFHRLALIARQVEVLAPEVPLTLEAYRADPLRQSGIERLLQTSLEAVLDVCKHLLRVRGVPRPDKAHELVIAAGAAGILATDLAEALAPAAGLRNRLVHEYGDLDDAKVLDSVRDTVRLLPQFVAAIERYLDDPAL